jgi:Nucleotidyl transferase AbiEii toxin, Type IV TA system
MSWNPWQFFARLRPDPGPPTEDELEALERSELPAAAPEPPAPSRTSRTGLPNTFRSASPDDGATRPRLFDPALAQFRSAFRPGDPTFQDPQTARRWAELRRVATDHVLRRIAESRWGDHLILRGSRLQKAWLGDQAREPGDLDWVSDLPVASYTSHRANELFEGLVAAVFAGLGPAGVDLVRESVATDAIWTYDRTPGRRAVFPWRVAGLPGGSVQVDVVFGERLADPDVRISIPVADGGCVSVRAASPAQSLAWKFLWLDGDTHPQGKDLFDAVLLAERFPLPMEVLAETFRGGLRRDPLTGTAADYVAEWAVDWDNFKAEYPWVGGDGEQWLKRLEVAIGPTFGELGSVDRGRDGLAPLDPSWLTTTVVELARGIVADQAWDRLPILSDALQEAGCDRDDVVAHCLRNGPHSRGCWVVDLILGGPAKADSSTNPGS